jgi:hypothetical protein
MFIPFFLEKFVEIEKCKRDSSCSKDLKMCEMADHERRKCINYTSNYGSKSILCEVAAEKVHSHAGCEKRKQKDKIINKYGIIHEECDW